MISSCPLILFFCCRVMLLVAHVKSWSWLSQLVLWCESIQPWWPFKAADKPIPERITMRFGILTMKHINPSKIFGRIRSRQSLGQTIAWKWCSGTTVPQGVIVSSFPDFHTSLPWLSLSAPFKPRLFLVLVYYIFSSLVHAVFPRKKKKRSTSL